MVEQPPEFVGAEDAPVDVAEVHRWYLFRLADGRTVQVGVTRSAAAAWLAAEGGDEVALDAWAIDNGSRLLAGRPAAEATDLVLDLDTGGG